MKRDPLSLGMILSKLRFERQWTQDQVVTKMHNRGYYMTRQILGNLETGRSRVVLEQLDGCIDVYKLDPRVLFPIERRLRRRAMMEPVKEVPTRKRPKRRIRRKVRKH